MKYICCILIVCVCLNSHAKYIFEAGHPTLQRWLLPHMPPTPKDNPLTLEKIELGKKLFFDPRLSANKNMSCASCHSPLFGWSDGLKTAVGHNGKHLSRASPVITNSAYNYIQMWDGRSPNLEHQALGPMRSTDEMNIDMQYLMDFLGSSGYRPLFEKAFPEQQDPVSELTLGYALASFERTVVSNNSPFDKWIRGNKSALTQQQIDGFKLFVSSEKGNCAVCHSAPNFTDDGFHNLGLASFKKDNPDLGRYHQKPIKLMKGAFKTPTLRDITLSAPYFHDGSASTLDQVMEHYIKGGEVKDNLSPNMKPLSLSEHEKLAIIAFMQSLTTQPEPFVLPQLPL